MAHIVLDCPHCFATDMTMKVVSRLRTRADHGVAFAQCGRCTMPVTAMLAFGPNKMIANVETWVGHPLQDVVEDAGMMVITTFPATTAVSAPASVDADVARVFVQAEGARKRKERDTAGMGYRKTLDIALKKFDQNLKGDLRTRIDALATRHDITPAMQDWAHAVRLIGNDANHEHDEPDEADIEAIAAFTETLLKYLFTLPAEVAVRKGGG
jgi:hypothetical protein